jgi:putative flippase GtrA
MNANEIKIAKKDLYFAVFAGFLIGLLFLPVLKNAKPDLYEHFFYTSIPFFLIATPLGLVIAYEISKKISFIWQLGKFGISGILNVLVDMGVLSLLTFFFRNNFQIEANSLIFSGITFLSFYSVYKSISFIIANINSYYWNKYWTFDQNADKKKSEFIQFFIVSLLGFFINVFVASLAFHIANPTNITQQGQWEIIGAAIGSIVGLAWNFIGYKFIVFKK